jgi:hypothetical protein
LEYRELFAKGRQESVELLLVLLLERLPVPSHHLFCEHLELLGEALLRIVQER